MSWHREKRTEHAGAKKTKGFWGTKKEAKECSKKTRRKQDKDKVRRSLKHEVVDEV